MRLYVETHVRAYLDQLWEQTQRPEQHQRWDLRFSTIEYLASEDPDAPQRFRYATRLLPGLVVAGTGIAAGERRRPDGTRTSALRFCSPHPLSLLAEGRGYWRYVPAGDTVCFYTGYDYRPRWGWFGGIADRVVFRPLMLWATAWSFDRLRLWCEQDVSPELARCFALGETLARALAILAAFVGAAYAGVSVTGVLVAAAVTLSALLLPPLPVTPSARRCLTRPPARRDSAGRTDVGTRPPTILADLEAS